MRMPPGKYLIGAAALALLCAGVAEAATAQLHTMKIDAPDGSVVQVRYAGNVAPTVRLVPAAATPASHEEAMDPFARMDEISAMMEARMQAMMQHAAILQQQAAQMQRHAVLASASNGAPGLALVGNLPKGARVSYYSSSTDAKGCTRSVSYSSDGSGTAPKMTQAASDGCDAATLSTQAIPAKIEKPADQTPPSGQTV